MSEQDVKNTDQVAGDGEVQPDTAEDGTAQGEQQGASSEDQVTETSGDLHHDAPEESAPQEEPVPDQVTEVSEPIHHEASEESESAGEGEAAEQAPVGDAPETPGGGAEPGDTALETGTLQPGPPLTDDNTSESASQPGGTFEFDDSSELKPSNEDTNSGEGTLTSGGGMLTSGEVPPDALAGEGNGASDDDGENEGGDNADGAPVESVEEPEQEPVVVDAGPEDDATPVEVGSDPPPEDSVLDYPEPEPTVPPDDGPGNDEDGGKSVPIYEVQVVDPRIAEIQAQVDRTHLAKDNEDDDDDDLGEEEELQGIFAAPEVERPIVDDQPAPGAGPIPPQPGAKAELDVFEMKSGGDADGTDPELTDLKVTGDADASPPAIVTPDLKTSGDADGTDPEFSSLKFGGDADGTDPESPRFARDDTLRFDLVGTKDDDAKDTRDLEDIKDTDETTSKFEVEDADAFLTPDMTTFEPDPVTTAGDIASAASFRATLFPVADDDVDDEAEDDSIEDF